MDASNGDAENLTGLLDSLDEQIEGEDDFSVEDLLDAFGARSFGPLLAVPAIIALSPLGAIPGVPATLGVFVVLVSGQHLIGKGRPWVPSRLRDRGVSADTWSDAREKVAPWAARADRVIEPRMTWLTTGPMAQVIGVATLLLGAAMVPLELVPFAVYAPGAALLALGLALSARDGVLAIFGLIASALSGALVYVALS